MNDTPPAPSRLSIVAPRVVTLLAFLFALGFLLHTSHDRVLLGKYNVRYGVFLAVIFFVLLPLIYFVARFFAKTHELKGSGGRKVLLRPRVKIGAALVLGVVGYILGNWYLSSTITGNVATHDAHAFHPFLQNIARPNHEAQHVNHWGFRGDEIEMAKPAKTFRIFIFGGSTVHCGTVPFEQTHCRVLEERLQKAYPQYKIEVQNLGAEWHCTEHDTIKLLFFAQDFSPDLVIMFHGINDLVRSFEVDFFGDGPYRSDYRHYYGADTGLVQPSRLSWLFFNAAAGWWCSDFRFDQVRLAGPEGNGLKGMITMFFPKSQVVEVESWNALPAFDRNTRDFVDIARAKKMNVLLATQASIYRDDLSERDQELLSFPKSHQFDGQRASLKSMTRGMAEFNEALRQICEEKAVQMVDLDQQMPKTTEFLYDDVHYTKAGNALIGNALADAIEAWGIIPATVASGTAPSENTAEANAQP